MSHHLRPGALLALAAALLALAAVPATAGAAALQDSLVPQTLQGFSPDQPPPGYRLSARDASRLAQRVPAVREQTAGRRGVRRDVVIPVYSGTAGSIPRWQVTYHRAGDGLVEVHVDGRSGRVLEVWTGPQVDSLLARGYEPSAGQSLNKPYIWIPLALLFLVPFIDPRRPFRLLHLDLLVLLGFGVSQIFFNRGEIDVSVPLAYPFLAYLLARMLIAGFRPKERTGPLVPFVPAVWLTVGLVALVGFRIGMNVVDSNVIDVGYASVVGADRIVQNEELYTDNEVHGDAYGPFNYVAYLPFEAVFPTSGEWDDLPAAHAATVAFDLLTLLGLFLLGRRLREGREGRRLGLALAWAWAAYPYTLYAMQENTNDGLVALLLVGALLTLHSPPGRGALVALGAAAKFVSLALAPLFAAGTGERDPLTLVRYAGVLLLILAVATIAYLPDGGLREMWDATLGYQLGRESPFSLWGLHPSLEWIQTVLKVGATGLALALFFVPRQRDLRQVAALGAAVIVALQLAATHWFYFYIVWFVPLVLVALLGSYRWIRAEEEEGAVTAHERALVAA